MPSGLHRKAMWVVALGLMLAMPVVARAAGDVDTGPVAVSLAGDAQSDMLAGRPVSDGTAEPIAVPVPTALQYGLAALAGLAVYQGFRRFRAAL